MKEIEVPDEIVRECRAFVKTWKTFEFTNRRADGSIYTYRDVLPEEWLDLWKTIDADHGEVVLSARRV